MNLRQLEFFAALARERHFGRAAAACHVSQPAMSMAIRKLEDELGVQLVQRGPGDADLTEEGRMLVDRARAVVATTDGILTEASRLRGNLTATLRLGVVPTAVAAVPAIIGPLLRDHPGVRVEVRTTAAKEIAAGIVRHDLDAGVAYIDQALRGFVSTELYTERLLLLQTGEAESDGEAPITWAEAADLPLCLLTSETQHRRIIDAAFAEAGVTGRPRIEADSFGILLGLVRDGWPTIVGHTWLADHDVPERAYGRPLLHPRVAPSIGLLTSAADPVSPVVRVLRETCELPEVRDRLRPTADA